MVTKIDRLICGLDENGEGDGDGAVLELEHFDDFTQLLLRNGNGNEFVARLNEQDVKDLIQLLTKRGQ